MNIAILLYVLYFGSLSLIQSILFAYYPTTTYSELIEKFVNIFNLSLKETSLQIISSELALNIYQNFIRFLVIGLLLGLPLIVQYAVFLIPNTKKFMIKIQVVSEQLFQTFKVPITLTLVIAVISLVIILPRFAIITTGGGISGFKANQLQIIYGSFN